MGIEGQGNVFEYGKKEAVRIKGIAIIFMFMLHFFANPEWILQKNMYVTFSALSMEILMVLSKFGHICVALFAFTTGYAMYVQKEKYKMLKYRTKKCMQFLMQYWLVVLVFLLYGWIANEPMPKLGTFLLQCMGIGTGMFLKGINVCTAWYVAFYIIFVLVHSILIKFAKKNFWLDSFIYFICLYVVSFVIARQSIVDIPQSMLRFIERFGLWGTIGMIGYLFAKYQMFKKADVVLRNQKKVSWNMVKGLMILILLMIIVIRFLLGNMAITDMVYAPLFIYIVSVLCNELNAKLLDMILLNFAKYSTYMWFIHSIFFTPNNSLQWLAYFPKYPLLILGWTLIITLLISIVLKRCYNGLEIFLRKILVDNKESK